MSSSSNWEFLGNGIWVNRALDRRVTLNEDYRNTFRAYSKADGYWQYVYRNKNGNPIRFRSREAAIRHAEKDATVKAVGKALEEAYPWGYRSKELKP